MLVRRAVLLISVYDPESAVVCLPVWQQYVRYTVVPQVEKPKAPNQLYSLAFSLFLFCVFVRLFFV